MKIFITIFILIITHIQVLFSQSYLVHTYNENSGLSSSLVNCITQDHSGRMWFATRTGITVYDGLEWKSYSSSDSLPSILYSKVAVDEKGIVWILPGENKLLPSYFENNQWQTLPSSKEITNKSTLSFMKILYINDERYIAVGSQSSGLYIHSHNTWKNYKMTDGLAGDQVNGICTWNSQFYIATENGISIFNGKNFDNILNTIKLPSYNIKGITLEYPSDTRSSSVKFWIAGMNWIGYILDNQFSLVKDNLKILSIDEVNHFVNLLPDYKNGLYFGNRWDLFHYTAFTENIEHLGRETGLIAEGANSIFFDREKNLWISSQRGVSKIASMRFKNYNESHGLLENEVSAICEYAPGKFIFGHNRGLTIFDGSHMKQFPFVTEKFTSDQSLRVLDIAVDNNDNIWITSSSTGLVKITKDHKIQWYNNNNLPRGNYSSIIIDNSNNIWFAISNDDATLFKLENGKFVNIRTGNLPFVHIRKLCKGPGDVIYCATPKYGVYEYSHDQWKQYIHPTDNMANNVYSVFFDSQSTIWVGTLAGLYVIDSGEIKKFSQNNFEINCPVYVIIEDAECRMWFGTDNGVIRWDGYNARKFTVNDGFAGQETNRSAGIVDSKGRVWIGTDLGASCYQEEFDKDFYKIPSPIMELENLKVGEKTFNLHNEIQLSHSMNNLEFHFKGISFIDEKSLQYQCKLEGFDEDWVEHKSSFSPPVRYTNLSPGHYRFHVKVKNALNRWSEVQSSNLIIIEKPFWKEWWYYLFLSIGAMLIAFSIHRNITQRQYSSLLEIQVKERTSQLEESENRYRKMFESNQAVMVMINPIDRKIIDANPSSSKFYGHTIDKIKSLSLDDLTFLEADRKIMKKLFDSHEKSQHLIMKHVLADSQIRDVEIYSCPINIQGKNLHNLIIHDITERKIAEDALAEEKERLAVTLSSIGDGVISADVQGKIILMNEVAEELTGWRCKDSSKYSIDDIFKIFHHETKIQFTNLVNKIVEQHDDDSIIQHSILISKSGKEYNITHNGAPIRDITGKIIGIVIVFRDMTSWMKMEEELRKANKIESIGILAGGIAHDFNNILTTIVGSISLAKLIIRPEDNVYKLLSDAESASFQAKDLTNQLLTFAKGGAPVKKTVHMGEFIKESVNFYLRGSSVRSSCSISDDLWSLEVDEGQMNQVINNLVLNSIQAMPAGGIIQISAVNYSNNNREFIPLKEGKFILITFTDTGIGIPNEYIKNIFDPYFTTKQKGNGLGLSIVYSIIKKHNGYITVSSEPGHGTTFKIYLPASLNEVAAKAENKQTLIMGTGKILVMDDDPGIQRIMHRMLSNLGYQVDLSNDGNEALDLYQKSIIEKSEYDLVIMDLTIPGGMGGKETIGKLKELNPNIKTIVSSGYSNDPILADFRKYGFDGRLNKPFKIVDLSKIVNIIINNGNADS